ncbi:MAG: hypothetical protein WC805_03020 [Patescibacteria group bacterium]|jgi:hypothetical protein
MKKTPSWITKFGIHQIVAVVLILAIAGFLGTQWAGGKLKAATTSNYILTVALTDDQPAALSQTDENQKVAQFRLTTDSPEPVVVSAFKFNLTGGIKNKVYRLTTLVPLSIVYGSDPIGLGESWMYDYGLLEQTVILSKNLAVAKDQPAVIDVYADLTRQKDQAFGLELAGVDSPLLTEGIPVQSTLYKIKR